MLSTVNLHPYNLATLQPSSKVHDVMNRVGLGSEASVLSVHFRGGMESKLQVRRCKLDPSLAKSNTEKG